MKKKLKRKIWIISATILLVYTIALISNPTIITALLPIIIPAAILTVGIPSYAVIKHLTEILEEQNKIPTKTNYDINSNNQNQIKQEKNISPKVIHNEEQIIYETDYQQSQQDKPKVKTKGTIH